MFGYILPDKPELKIKEYELFKAYYCGLCKSISIHYGQIPRFALSYDCAFLGLFLSSIHSSRGDVGPAKCITKPFRKIPVILDNPILEYAAAANVIFSYHKIEDDIRDDRSYKYLPLILLLRSPYKRARNRVPALGAHAKFYLSELANLEGNNCASIDAAARPFANLLAKTFSGSGLFHDTKILEALEDFGYNIGKWLYTIDALDDMASDTKSGNYNPIIEQFLKVGKDPDSSKQYIEDVEFILKYSLKRACIAYESLEIKSNKEILDNIIYGGMYKKTDETLNKELEP
ncbi:MAG TPA: DUF5685 family protein [Clostridia bacterium]|nr:DUF5685 family protein [Clostridia bacterium]